MKEKIILQWIKKAEDDIKASRHLLDSKEIITGAICFHCQQAVEKYLKAYLTQFDIRVKKTHDMVSILDLCTEQDKDFESLDREKISNLTFYSVEVRYPDDFYIPSIEEAEACFIVAGDVKDFILKKLNLKEEDLI